MKRILMVLAVALLATSAAQAEESTYDTVLRKFGEAFAIGEKCPSLAPNPTWSAVYAMGLGIEIDDAFKRRMAAEVERARNTIAELDSGSACLMGHMLYGKNGTNGPNLLMDE